MPTTGDYYSLAVQRTPVRVSKSDIGRDSTGGDLPNSHHCGYGGVHAAREKKRANQHHDEWAVHFLIADPVFVVKIILE
jgi:hypothetical protein